MCFRRETIVDDRRIQIHLKHSRLSFFKNNAFERFNATNCTRHEQVASNRAVQSVILQVFEGRFLLGSPLGFASFLSLSCKSFANNTRIATGTSVSIKKK